MAIFRRANNYWIDFYVEGRRKRKKVGSNYRMAQLALQKAKVSIAEGKFLDVSKSSRILFDEIAQDFLNYSKNNKRSFGRDVQLVNHLFGSFKGKRLKEISPVVIESYKGKRLGEGTAPATVNRELACGKAIFNWAVKSNKTSDNPFRKVTFFKEDNEILRYLTVAEIKRLLDACPFQLKAVVATALNTGMRKGEILNLKWKDVKLTDGLIFVEHTKSGKPRQIPINGQLRDVLLKCLNRRQNDYVFLNDEGKKYKDVRTAFRNALKRAKLSTDFRFHDLRHTFASQMVMAGIDLATVREILGHSNIKTTMRYAHLSPVHKREALEILGSRIQVKSDAKMDTIWTPEQGGEKVEITNPIDFATNAGVAQSVEQRSEKSFVTGIMLS